tara:strand:+ start:160 stop:495 length:336 start_codon:yes stop_codon:yes gene_type:complete
MSKFFCKNINLFKKKLLNDEKIRIKIIIQLLEEIKLNDIENENNYNKLINNYNIIFKNKENKHNDNIELLKTTEYYLKDQINILISNNKNKFLIDELQIELEHIELLKKML